MQFKYYPVERLLIESVTANLTDEEQLVRCKIMDSVITYGEPVSIECLKTMPELNDVDIDEIISQLINKRRIVLDEQERIIFVYPVSALPTNHRVTLSDGRSLNAMCAIDAMGVAFTLNQDTIIQSQCSMCGEQITVNISDGNIVAVEPSDTHVLHVDLNKMDNWAGSC